MKALSTITGTMFVVVLSVFFALTPIAQADDPPAMTEALVYAADVLPAMHRKCWAPSHIDNCAGFCNDVVQCRQCCARGGFTSEKRDECIDLCNRVFLVTLQPNGDLDVEISWDELPSTPP